MKLKDLQAFIPGWNIIYIAREGMKMYRDIRRLEDERRQRELNFQEDLTIVRSYAIQRERAKLRGDLEGAEEFDSKIVEIVFNYINRAFSDNHPIR